jgi:large subunit ribosomal protein L1
MGSGRRFDETIEAHVKLRVDARRGDQMVRGAAPLPVPVGKQPTICVFADGLQAEQARAAGGWSTRCNCLKRGWGVLSSG